jgi:hypothetical protein
LTLCVACHGCWMPPFIADKLQVGEATRRLEHPNGATHKGHCLRGQATPGSLRVGGDESRDSPDSCGMEWWQTVIVGLAPAVVTALALIYQQRRADEREGQRRRDERAERSEERQHQVELAKRDRRYVVTDAWRDDRKSAHAEAIAALDEYSYGLWRARVPLGAQSHPFVKSPEPISNEELQSARDRSTAAVSVVRLLASDAASEQASLAHQKLSEIASALTLAGENVGGLSRLHGEATTAVSEYVRAARRELETDDPAS